MDCGVPFCHEGCPLGNLIPDWNDLVYRGEWREAHRPAARDQQLPRVHRADLPGAVRVGVRAGDQRRPGDDQADRAGDRRARLRRGLGRARAAAATRTGRTVAVVGSGPAGLAAAAELNQCGPRRSPSTSATRGPAGCMRFGVPDAKLEKWIIDRRVGDARGGGDRVRLRRRRRHRRRPPTSCDERHDAVVLAIGSRVHARPRRPRPRARRRPLRDGLPLPAQPRGRRPATGRAAAARAPARRSPPRASTSS